MNGAPFTFPDPKRLPAKSKRVIWHWTAGGHHANAQDLRHYHALLEWHEGQVRILSGVPIRNNMVALGSGVPTYDPDYRPDGYAAHTRGFNSWSVGFAICGMFGAIDRDNLGDFPMLPEQVDALIGLSVNAAAVFGLPITEGTFFSHYEAGSLHGVPQPGKWDICWVPQVPELGRDEVGPWLRARMVERMEAG